MKKRGGFTLLELLIVIIIIGILAAAGIPYYARLTDRAKLKEANTHIDAIKSAEARWCADNSIGNFFAVTATSTYTPATGGLDIGWNTRYWNFEVTTPGAGQASIKALTTTGTSYNVTCNITNTNYQGTFTGNMPGWTAP